MENKHTIWHWIRETRIALNKSYLAKNNHLIKIILEPLSQRICDQVKNPIDTELWLVTVVRKIMRDYYEAKDSKKV